MSAKEHMQVSCCQYLVHDTSECNNMLITNMKEITHCEKKIGKIDEHVSISPNVKEDIKEEGVEKDSA